MDITFLGATRTVTGSSYLVHHDNFNMLIDCGLYQGNRELKERNYLGFAFKPADINALVLTHAHIDHIGLVPRLVSLGFHGPIMATPATLDLARVLMEDSARLMEDDSERINRRRRREGKPPRAPLNTMDDVRETIKLFNPLPYDTMMEVGGGMSIQLRDAGHILGSAMVMIDYKVARPSEEKENEGKGALDSKEGKAPGCTTSRVLRPNPGYDETPTIIMRPSKDVTWREPDRRRIVFSGDLGRNDAHVIRDPTVLHEADYVIIESTYGDRDHKAQRGRELLAIIRSAVRSGGKVLIPAFSVGRTQEILYELNELVEAHEIPRIPVFVDSPLAIKATEIFEAHPECYDAETKELLAREDNPFDFKGLKLTRTRDESMSINSVRGPAIIIAGSGMCEGGRIQHHLKHHAWDDGSQIVFVGYQAQGTLGRAIIEGSKYVDIMGERLRINARIHTLGNFSAHAGKAELIQWLSGFTTTPDVFVTHGEESASMAFSDSVSDELGLVSRVPTMGETYCLL